MDLLEHRQTYPDAPGYKEPTTSREAADRIAPIAANLRAAVLDAIKRRPMTADEVATVLDRSVLSIRPRVTELFRTGQIVRTGGRRQNSSGVWAHVYRVPA